MISAARRGLVLVAALVLLGTAALVASAGASSGFAQATLRDGTGATVGTVRSSVMGPGKVMVTASVRGLPPGFHGFHIHGVGDCSGAGFLTAGTHFVGAGGTHPTHAGDQPVLLVNADGTGTATFVTDRYAIVDLFDADGSAFIVHALADNYANIPTRYAQSGPDATTLGTGDAGGRLACGVIGLTP